MPFKERVKQLIYMRKYQEEKRAKLKEAEDLNKIETAAVKIMREALVARRIFPVELANEKNAEGLTVPVIGQSCDVPFTPETFEEAVKKVAGDEDRLLLTGDHKGWPCFGIEGLATATGRNSVKYTGNWEETMYHAMRELFLWKQKPPYVLICPSLRQLPIGPREEISEIYESTNLFRKDGTRNNMLLVKPGQDNFTALCSQDFKVTKTKDGLMFHEALRPKIKNPDSICEITWP